MTSSVSQSARTGTPSRRTPTRALKRKRNMLEESTYSLSDFKTTSTSKSDIEISEVDAEGKFIRLSNKGEKVNKNAAHRIERWRFGHDALLFFCYRNFPLAAGKSFTRLMKPKRSTSFIVH